MLELAQEMGRITPEGELEPGVDPEIDRLKSVLSRYNEVLKAALKKANADLHARMENNTVTLKGSQLLGMFGEKGEAGLKGMLEKRSRKRTSRSWAKPGLLSRSSLRSSRSRCSTSTSCSTTISSTQSS